MSAITVRSLPDDVHDGLRALASEQGVSVESLVRGVLAEAAGLHKAPDVNGSPEMQQRWQEPNLAVAAAPGAADLWGVLRGTVQVALGVELSSPVGEGWDAEA